MLYYLLDRSNAQHHISRDAAHQQEIKMTKVIGAIMAVMLVASPAFAQPSRHAAARQASATTASGVVTVDGQYIGKDPDPNVRNELRRDYGYYLGD
jgi:hypothetical protein